MLLQRKKHFLKQAEDNRYRLDEQIVRETELSKDVDSLRARGPLSRMHLGILFIIDGLAEKNVDKFRWTISECDAEETLLLNGVQNALISAASRMLW